MASDWEWLIGEEGTLYYHSGRWARPRTWREELPWEERFRLHRVHIPSTRTEASVKFSKPTFIGTLPKAAIVESEGPSELESPSDYERLAARHSMLLSLIGSEGLNARLDVLFPYSLEKRQALIVIDQVDVATLGDYIRYLGSIDRLYKLLLTLFHQTYFTEKWLRGNNPDFAPEDLLVIETIKKQSPAELQVTGVGEVVRALGDVLSVGKQVTDFKLAGVKVEEAKLELERKKREFDAEAHKQQQQAVLSELDMEIEREKRLLELEQLRTKRDEEQRKRQNLLTEYVSQQLEMLAKGVKVLSEVPEEMRSELRAALFTELEIMNRTPLAAKSLQLLPEKKT